jgi:hypothetical protein
MDHALVEEVARRLAEFDVARQAKDHEPNQKTADIVTELHRAKARIAIATIDRFRRGRTSH